MSLEKQIVVDVIQVMECGSVQVRTSTRIVEDGKTLSENYHRHVIAPGDDYSNEDDRVKAICAAIQTPQTIAAYQAMLEANKPKAEA